MRVELILFFLVSLTLTSCSNGEKKSVVKTQRNYPVDSFKNYSFNLINTDYDFERLVFHKDFLKQSDAYYFNILKYKIIIIMHINLMI